MIIYLKILSLFKDYWKPLSYVILIMAIIILFIWGKSENIRANEAEDGRDAAIEISNDLTKLSHRYKNKQGDSVIVTQVIGIPKSQVDELMKQKDLFWLRKLEGIKKDGSNLQSAETFETSFDFDKVEEKVKYLPCKDSVKTFKYSLNDKWNNIEANVIDTPKIEIRDRYYAAIELRRPKHWFWKLQWSKREPVAEITNSNKLIKIDSVVVIDIKP